MTLEGRTALITGAGSGIGRAAAHRLARAGARLCLVDRNLDAVAGVAATLSATGTVSQAIEADVVNQMAMEDAVARCRSVHGGLDILVHSAGVGIERTFLDTTAEEWRRLIDIDLTGTFYTCQAAARAMVDRGGGRIVTIASTAGMRGGTGRAAYGAAKAGVIGLTRVMAVELAAHGITVNCLAPGAIETELVAAMHSPETRTAYRAGIPMDRYGLPEEVADAALFLASDAAAYVTGQILGVDGGFLAAGVMHRHHS